MNNNTNQPSAAPQKTRNIKLLYADKEKIWAWFKDCQLNPNHFTKRQWCDKVKINTSVETTPTQMRDFLAEHELTWDPISGKQAASDRATAQFSVTSQTSVSAVEAKALRVYFKAIARLQAWYTESTKIRIPSDEILSPAIRKALGEIVAKRALKDDADLAAACAD